MVEQLYEEVNNRLNALMQQEYQSEKEYEYPNSSIDKLDC
jgi:hypothetical protein